MQNRNMNVYAERRSIMDKLLVPPVSIEQFAAYLDKNLSALEMREIDMMITSSPIMGELAEISDIIDEDYQFNCQNASSFEEEASLLEEEFSLPDLNEKSNLDMIEEYFFDSLYHKGEIGNDSNLNFKEYMDMEHSHQYGASHFGETGQNIYDPIFIRQPDDHSCALRSQQIILRDFGIDIPFQDLEKLALEYGVYSENGTNMYDVGKVLELAGVGMHQVEGSNMLDLTSELSKGHRVIVGVDADELWYSDKLTDKLKNWFNDTFKEQGGNHALIVAGVDVNPQNPDDVKVILTDPGSGALRVEYPMNQFMDAWKDSNCYMVATDNPAPYQYDPATGMEVPSNFLIEQHFNQFVAENSYQLSPDMINIPTDYQPIYNDHLNFVGDNTYEEFQKQYEDYKENQRLFASSVADEDTDTVNNETPTYSISKNNNDDLGEDEQCVDPKKVSNEDEDDFENIEENDDVYDTDENIEDDENEVGEEDGDDDDEMIEY